MIFVAVFHTAVESVVLVLISLLHMARRASEQLGVARRGGMAGERIRAVRRGDGRTFFFFFEIFLCLGVSGDFSDLQHGFAEAVRRTKLFVLPVNMCTDVIENLS